MLARSVERVGGEEASWQARRLLGEWVGVVVWWRPGRGAGGDFIVGERAGARGENIRVRGEVGPGAQREHVPLLPAGFRERGRLAFLGLW